MSPSPPRLSPTRSISPSPVGDRSASSMSPQGSADSRASLKAAILAQARRLGFDLVGVTTPDPPPHFSVFESWLSAGRHGEMAYLASERSLSRRLDPRQILPECRSILVLGTRYSPSVFPLPAASPLPSGSPDAIRPPARSPPTPGGRLSRGPGSPLAVPGRFHRRPARRLISQPLVHRHRPVNWSAIWLSAPGWVGLASIPA